MIEPDVWINRNLNPEEGLTNPASLDVRLGGHVITRSVNTFSGDVIEREMELAEGERLHLEPGVHYLLCTKEVTRCPATHAWLFTLKSSMGRRGIFLAHPGWGDPGFEGQVTFSVSVQVPTDLVVGQKVGQLIYFRMAQIPAATYDQTGRYQNSIGITKEKE